MLEMNDPLPPYPCVPREFDKDGWVISEEFLIPMEEKQAYLNAHYPFEGVPNLDDELLDMHADKNFFVRDFMLVREHKFNMIVSPYYYESGGSVIDWVPLDAWTSDDEDDGYDENYDDSNDPKMDDLDDSDFDWSKGELPF